MRNRLLVLGLLLLVVVENGFILWFGAQLKQVKTEMLVLQQQVAQLRVWRAGMGNGRPPAPDEPKANPAGQAGTGPAVVRGGPPQPLALFLAKLVILQNTRSLSPDKGQLDRIQARLDEYERRNRELVPLQKKLADTWNGVDVVLSDPQRRYLDDHQKQVENKADELLLVLRKEDGSLVDMLADFVRESRASL